MEVSQNPTEKKYLKISIGAQESYGHMWVTSEKTDTTMTVPA